MWILKHTFLTSISGDTYVYFSHFWLSDTSIELSAFQLFVQQVW